jgi:NTE family protein
MIHKLRHVVSELVKLIPEEKRKHARVRELRQYGCLMRMQVVRLLAARLDNENQLRNSGDATAHIRLAFSAQRVPIQLSAAVRNCYRAAERLAQAR